MRRVACVGAMVVLVVLSSGPRSMAAAGAATCERGTPAEKGEAALPRLSYPWQNLGYTVQFLPGRSGILGMTYPDERRIEVYVRECQSVDSVAHVFGHEIGHAVDDRFNDAGRRQEWKRIRGFEAEWYTCRGCSDYRTGSGDFAEVFSLLKAPPDRFRSAVAGPPSPEQAGQLERFFHPVPPPETAAPPPPDRGILDLLGLLRLRR